CRAERSDTWRVTSWPVVRFTATVSASVLTLKTAGTKRPSSISSDRVVRLRVTGRRGAASQPESAVSAPRKEEQRRRELGVSARRNEVGVMAWCSRYRVVQGLGYADNCKRRRAQGRRIVRRAPGGWSEAGRGPRSRLVLVTSANQCDKHC